MRTDNYELQMHMAAAYMNSDAVLAAGARTRPVHNSNSSSDTSPPALLQQLHPPDIHHYCGSLLSRINPSYPAAADYRTPTPPYLHPLLPPPPPPRAIATSLSDHCRLQYSSDLDDDVNGFINIAQLLQQCMGVTLTGESSSISTSANAVTATDLDPEALLQQLLNRIPSEKEEMYRREAMKPMDKILVMASSRSPVVEVELTKYMEMMEGYRGARAGDGEEEEECEEEVGMEGCEKKRKAELLMMSVAEEEEEEGNSSSHSTCSYIYRRKSSRRRRRSSRQRSNHSNKYNNNNNNNKSTGGRSSKRISSDPQSVAARERRGRIRERMEALRHLVPGCSSKLDTATMLHEATLYLLFLQTHLQRYLLLLLLLLASESTD